MIAALAAAAVCTWTVAPGAPVQSGALSAVSAAGPGDVWAVGARLAEHWDGAAWQTAPLPADASDVAAVDAENAWAVGGRTVQRWDGTAWRIVSTTSPDARLGSGARRSLSAVVARAADDVWAVGADWRKGADLRHPWSVGVVLHWDGQEWRSVAPPLRDDASFEAVLSAGARDVWLAGETSDGNPLALHWNGESWRLFHLPAPPNGGEGVTITSIIRHGANEVTILGTAAGPVDGFMGDTGGVVYRWHGRRWSLTMPDHFGNFLSYDDAASLPGHGVWSVANDTDPMHQQDGSQLFTTEHPHRRLRLPPGHVIESLAWDGSSLWGVGWIGTGLGAPDVDYSYKDFAPLIMRYGCG